jgi:hypothetical protein
MHVQRIVAHLYCLRCLPSYFDIVQCGLQKSFLHCLCSSILPSPSQHLPLTIITRKCDKAAQCTGEFWGGDAHTYTLYFMETFKTLKCSWAINFLYPFCNMTGIKDALRNRKAAGCRQVLQP